MAVRSLGGSLRRQRRAMLWPLLIWAVFSLGLHLAAPLLNSVSVHGFPLAFYIAAQGAFIVFAALGFWAASPWRRSAALLGANGTLLIGLSAAGLWMSGALPVALVGALFTYGHDGLAFAIGVSGGFILIACIVAPAFSSSAAATLPQFLTIRTGGVAAANAAALMSVMCLVLLVSAELELVRKVATQLFPGASGIGALIAASLAAVALAHISSIVSIRLQAAGYLLVLLFVAAFAAAMSLTASDSLVPQLAYGTSLRDLSILERTLVLNGFSDPSVVRPFVKPNASLSLENFLALSLSLMLGAAAMPHLLSRLAAAGSDPSPRQATAWALFMLVPLLVTLPAIAVFAKLDIYASIAQGATPERTPAWLEQARYSTSPAVCRDGCTDPGGPLRVQDITIDAEAILPSAPLIAEMPGYAAWLFIAALALAATLTAGRITAAMARTSGQLFGGRPDASERTTERVSELAVMAMAVAAAAFVAASLEVDLITRVSWSLSLAASGLFPMIVIAAVQSRASSPGLAAGGLVGFATALYYIVGSELVPLQFVDLWRDFSNMPPWRFEVLEELRRNCGEAVAGACVEAEQMARQLANWWGVDTRAAGVIGAPVGVLVAVVVSLGHALLRRARG